MPARKSLGGYLSGKAAGRAAGTTGRTRAKAKPKRKPTMSQAQKAKPKSWFGKLGMTQQKAIGAAAAGKAKPKRKAPTMKQAQGTRKTKSASVLGRAVGRNSAKPRRMNRNRAR